MSKKLDHFWTLRNQGERRAELLLYGPIASRSWYGDEVTAQAFAQELRALGPVEEITVRINSTGGDVFAATAIGNSLEASGAKLTARLEGLCASAATIVACHCHRVVACRDVGYMIHPVRVELRGAQAAEDLEAALDALRVCRENVLDTYEKKTGRSREEVAAWMDDTSWWTAKEAMANGFVDEVADGERLTVEDRGGWLFVNAVGVGLATEEAPQSMRDLLPAGAAGGDHTNRGRSAAPGKKKEEHRMEKEIKTVADLRAQFPDLADQLEQEAREAERTRIQDIEEMTLAGGEELARKAKYLEPCSSAQFAAECVKAMKAQGERFLDSAQQDALNSGAGQVPPDAGAGTGQARASADGKGADPFMDALREK